MQQKLIDSPSKSEKIEAHLDKMREMFHPTPQEKVNEAIEKTNKILETERKKKMSVEMRGDSAADFERQVEESVVNAKMVDPDPIMEATSNSYPQPKQEVKRMDESFPKYQYSVFLNGSRDEQLVIRANTFQEFLQLKREADVIINKASQRATAPAHPQPAQAPVPAPTANPMPPAPICAVHNVPMKWKQGVSKKNNKPYAFWSCSERMPDGNYCTYKPQ